VPYRWRLYRRHPDALLVTTRERAQDVKTLVDLPKATGRADLT